MPPTARVSAPPPHGGHRGDQLRQGGHHGGEHASHERSRKAGLFGDVDAGAGDHPPGHPYNEAEQREPQPQPGQAQTGGAAVLGVLFLLALRLGGLRRPPHGLFLRP